MNNRKFIIGIILFSLTIAVYSQTAADFEVNGTVLVRYRGTERDVNIPASLGITEIRSFAFSSSITRITIPASVTTIGWGAFQVCKSLISIDVHNQNTAYSSTDGVLFNKNKTILIQYPQGKQGQNYTIPAGVTTIEYGAFYNCTSLSSINIPAGLTTIGTSAFSGCESLTSITIPARVTSIGDRAFSGCTRLTSITLPAGVTNIGNGAFSGCESLTSITIPARVTSIGSDAFYNCTSLSSITIPASVISIGHGAFYGNSLTSINVHNQNTVYSSTDGVLFNRDKTILIKYPKGKQEQNYTIPGGVIEIGINAFSGSYLTSITIPAGVTTIEYGAFSESSLTTIIISAGVTSIGESAFGYCRSLTSITIPASVTFVGEGAFHGCDALLPAVRADILRRFGEYVFENMYL